MWKAKFEYFWWTWRKCLTYHCRRVKGADWGCRGGHRGGVGFGIHWIRGLMSLQVSNGSVLFFPHPKNGHKKSHSFSYISLTHHPLLLFCLTLGKSNGQLQLLLLLQSCLVSLGGHLVRNRSKRKTPRLETRLNTPGLNKNILWNDTSTVQITSIVSLGKEQWKALQ